MKQVKDLKVGSMFQMEGLDTDGKTVHADCTLRAYNGMNKYVVNQMVLVCYLMVRIG